MLLYLIGSSLGTGLISQIFRSAILAALYTILFARVIQILVLALGAIALNIMGSMAQPSQGMAVMLLVVSGIAALVPYAMWTVIFISRLKRERRVDLAVIENERKDTVVNEENRQEVASSRARNLMSGAKAETAEFGSAALRAASHAAAAFGIAKLAAFTTAKVTGSVPEGYSKIATGVAAGIGFAAAYGEKKAHQKIDQYSDKIGRPGASRARDLSGEG